MHAEVYHMFINISYLKSDFLTVFPYFPHHMSAFTTINNWQEKEREKIWRENTPNFFIAWQINWGNWLDDYMSDSSQITGSAALSPATWFSITVMAHACSLSSSLFPDSFGNKAHKWWWQKDKKCESLCAHHLWYLGHKSWKINTHLLVGCQTSLTFLVLTLPEIYSTVRHHLIWPPKSLVKSYSLK